MNTTGFDVRHDEVITTKRGPNHLTSGTAQPTQAQHNFFYQGDSTSPFKKSKNKTLFVLGVAMQ
jgi:hypothetical protein